MNPVDEYGALIYAGRWGIHGIALPGRVTFAPGNVGFATFGAPRPLEVCDNVKCKLLSVTVPSCNLLVPTDAGLFLFLSQTQIIGDETWKLIDGIWDKRVEEIRAEASMEIEEDEEKPQLLMASHFL